MLLLYHLNLFFFFLLGSAVDSGYASASHSQPSSRCEIQGGCRFMLNAHPSWVPAGLSQDFPNSQRSLDFSSVLSNVT